ncbi:MAG: hypothetical protein E6J90_33000 [Deltaproteobacteria bacterium]|nr:MAG: hypothetical protein E6J90_33000 [Deltaproteobacteria bacterium]TMQ19682.1 MAG: hypothetical protein E6J91_05710 [Deltaproteobacteria bacterium]
MFLPEETYAAAAAFVLGYDLACEGGVCIGFREWLVMRVGSGSNLSWTGLVLDVAFPTSKNPNEAVHASAETERHAIDVLFKLLAEYDDEVRSKNEGLSEVFLAYGRWLRKHRISS